MKSYEIYYIMFTTAVILSLLVLQVYSAQNILIMGAIPNQDTLSAQLINQRIINQAIFMANASQSTGDNRLVIIPEKTFYTLPISINYMHDIIVQIRGKITACNRIRNWPKNSNGISYQNFISIDHSQNITLRGGGKIDGRGYIWWLDSWIVDKKYLPGGSGRPHMISTDFVSNLVIHDLVLKNSPNYHIKLDQTVDTVIYNINIRVNTTAQLGILKRNYLIGIVPMFPLNTDGIDPQGRNFHIFNITCQNYDDVVVPKPAHSNPANLANCTQNMLIQNITVRLGVGLTVGTVPPRPQINCVRNITFRNAHMEKPFKGIYIKTNPGENGYGIIDNILYENITMHEPIWWALYLGPQQQKQPDRGGPGCMLYPFDPRGTCQTQPRINITNVKLKNIHIKNSLLFPIVMRCNETNPCKGIEFDNVQVKGWLIGKKKKGYICQNVEGIQKNSYPKLDCLTSTEQKDNEVTADANLREEEQHVDYSIILQAMQRASLAIPYEEDDDEMESSLFWSMIDHAAMGHQTQQLI